MTENNELIRSSAAALAGKLAAREVTAVEVTQAHLDRIAAVDGKVHAFLHVNTDEALAVAAEVDAIRAAGGAAAEELHALAGVPIAVKDLIVTVGQPTTAGSKILEGWHSPYDATVVQRLRAAKMPILGKTNMDEFAMGSSTEHSAYGPTRNPWDLERIPGGSGGGSAAALAAFQAPLAIGTDTGGSIRQPLPSLVDAARRGAEGDRSGVRVGVITELSGEGYQAGVQARFEESLELLVKAGAEVVEVSCPTFVHALATYYLIMPCEASSNLAKFDAMRYGLRVLPEGVDSPSAEQVMRATRDAGFGDEVKRRIILGTYALSAGYYDAYYGTAQRVRTLIARDFAAAFEKVDVLVSPTAPTTAFKLGEKLDDPLAMYLNDLATIPANLAGVPGMSLPSGLADEDGLPAGFQILAPALADDRMYRVGAALEAALHERWGGPLLDRAPALAAQAGPTDANGASA
ncbi:MAG: aspartyl/glutamyl-tRNA amidotransferase subunit A [Nocardioides sp.]|nr:aspartyl/glutamyl-tRNA amidotransferase subunit A [Nocardioides sp.]